MLKRYSAHMLARYSAVILAAGFCILGGVAQADTSAFTITDDASLNTAVANARSKWLATRPSSAVTWMETVVLIPNTNGTWRRGSYNPTVLSYPASTVKLGYLAAAMYWCRINGHPYNYLNSSVGPMITVSDNYQTGVVVDAISGAPNITDVNSTSDPRFFPWYNKRRFAENYLNGRGLLENQTMMHKTYPTNSNLVGAENTALNYRGSNQMQPKVAASLMLEIVKGAIEPGATSYMRGLLSHPLRSSYSPLSFGLPPGSTNEDKLGNAYDGLHDIAYVTLPNGKEAIIAAYTNGYESNLSSPDDITNLGPYAEFIIENMGLDAGNPAKIKKDNNTATYVGSWSTGTSARDKFGSDYRFNTGGSGADKCTWNLAVPQTGLYEVCVWYAQGPNRATDAPFTVNHNGGATTIDINQQKLGGRWVKLGDFNFNAGTGSVVLTDNVNDDSKIVLADCVKAVLHPSVVADIIVDNGSSAFTASANWSTGTSAADKYGSNYRFRSTAAISDSAQWNYNAPSTRNYEIYAWWSAGSNRSATAPYIVTRSGGTTNVPKNQQINGGSWQSLGIHSVNAGANNVKLSCWTTTGYVVLADAIKVTPR